MTKKSTDLDLLSAIHAHAIAHNLVNTIASVYVTNGYSPFITISSDYDTGDASGRRRFVRWARSVAATEIEDNVNASSYAVEGQLADGTAVTVHLTKQRSGPDAKHTLPVDRLDPDLDDAPAPR
ncbi:hypothetical protein [Amycolatopsis samaneae]|uniref:Uncharacterized protein n=1 Tax=Amycolatopsis samaneae TaxID=664691 RepID=A0ABW5GKH7_9PSEU